MKNSYVKKILFTTGILTTLLTACGNADASNKETTKEQSTRTPNSVVGRWYQYDGDDYLNVWVFQDNGEFYFAEEEYIDKEDETFEIARRKYSINGDKIILDDREATLEYTDYGLYIKYEDAIEGNGFYEYRQDALEMSDEYKSSDKYLETLKDENGCVIEDGVLIRYFTNDSEITIPDNVTEVGGFAIASELEEIEKLTIPGSVKKVGEGAFCETPLKVVIIEEGVEEIGESAFEDAYFNELHIPASVNSIGDFAFRINEGVYDAKIYIKKGSYAEEYFKEYLNGNNYDGAEIIVED